MPANSPAYPSLRIALADDSNLNRVLWVTLFREWNPDVTIDEAKNGEELVELVRKNRYDVVLTDVMMPVMNGIEAVQAIREFNPFIPIIGISGSGLDFELSAYKEAGMNSYITKPIEFSVLLREIGQLIMMDLEKPDSTLELSGHFARLRKVSTSDEHFENLKTNLIQEIDTIMDNLDECTDQRSDCHKLVNKLIYVNDQKLLNQAKKCEALFKNNEPCKADLKELKKQWDSFLQQVEM